MGRATFGERVTSGEHATSGGRVIGESGFSIIEVLVASVILVVGLTGYLSVAASTTDLGGRNTRVTNANTILYDQFDQLKAGQYANIIDTTATPDTVDIDGYGAIVPNGPYTRTITLTQLADATALTVAQVVTIQVSWSWKGVTHSITQSSVFMV